MILSFSMEKETDWASIRDGSATRQEFILATCDCFVGLGERWQAADNARLAPFWIVDQRGNQAHRVRGYKEVVARIRRHTTGLPGVTSQTVSDDSSAWALDTADNWPRWMYDLCRCVITSQCLT
jgi:hypothetical protein